MANLLITYGAAGAESTTVANASTYNFDSLSNGLNTGVVWTGIGTFDKVWAQPADQYGGAGGTGKYAVTGAEASSASLLSTTLTLNTPEAYVGFWFSAADAENTVTLFQGSAQLTTVSVSTLINAIGGCGGSNAYCGNPTTGQDAGEPFVYVNFFGTNGTAISTVVFSNANYNTGFEFDNVSVEGPQVTPSGTNLAVITAVPEPGTLAFLGGAGGGLGLLIYVRRLRRGNAAAVDRNR